jgi:glutathione synthase/RimK-type ligase-like ATP-grasp enzyme
VFARWMAAGCRWFTARPPARPPDRPTALFFWMRIAFATHAGLDGLTPSDRLAADELGRRGSKVTAVPWTDAGDWRRFDAVVLRATWDYYQRPGDFLAWLRGLESQRVRLWNPAPLAAWNLHKGYLRELERAGVSIVPTEWVAEASPIPSLAKLADRRGWADVVVKPAVSANANGTWRTHGGVTEENEQQFRTLVAVGEVMVQPVVESLVREGEWSLVFLGGKFSHAVLKRPATGDFRVQSIHGGTVARAEARPEWIAQARSILDAVPGPWLYARVDGCIVDDRFVLVELEMLEPDLFFNLCPEAATRFVDSFELMSKRWPSLRF